MIRNIILLQVKNDAKSIVRDPFLRYITPIPIFLSLGFITFQTKMIQILNDVNINYFDYSDLIVSFLFLTLCPTMFGIVYGYIFLDYKDENIFEALSVTPVGNGTLLIMKLIIPYILSILVTGLSLFIINSEIPLELLILVTILSGLNAPFYALLLAVFAKNKIQGMALQKISGILMIFPIISYFVKDSFVILLGIDPLFWNFQAYWKIAIDYNSVILYSIIGIAYYLLIIRIFLRNLM